MPRFKHAFNNFAAGELSPQAQGRTDSEQYKSGLAIEENMITYPTGGARRRPGTLFVKSYSSTRGSALIPFVYSQDESYLVVLRETFTSTIEIIPQPSSFGDLPIVPYTSGSGVTVGNELISYPAIPWKSVGGGAGVHDWENIAHAQSADRMWLVHPYMFPAVLSRTAQNTFTLLRYDDNSLYATPTDQVKAIPFRDANITSNTLRVRTITTAGNTCVLESIEPLRRFFTNEYYKITNSVTPNTGVVKVLSAGLSTCSAVVVVAFDTTAASTIWARSAWGGASGDTADADNPLPGYPRSVAFFQGRILYGGSLEFPDTVWASESFNYFRLLNQTLAHWTDASQLQTGNAAAMKLQIASDKVNEIQWMVPSADVVAIGTAGDEFSFGAGDPATGFGPSNYKIERQSGYGSNRARAVFCDNMVVYSQRDGRSVKGFIFDQDIQSFKSAGLNDYSNHFVPLRTREINEVPYANSGAYGGSRERPSVQQMVYQPSIGVVWFCDTYGGWFGLTINRQEKIASWHYHKLGGSHETFAGNEIGGGPKTRSLAVTPSPGGNGDLLWMLADRVVDGSVKTFLEYMPPEYLEPSIAEDGVYPLDDLETDQFEWLKPVFTDASTYRRLTTILEERQTLAGSSVDISSDHITIGGSVPSWWNGIPVVYYTDSGSLLPLVSGTTYYVVNRTVGASQDAAGNDTLALATSRGGAAINFTSASGNFVLVPLATSQWPVPHLKGQVVKALGDGGYLGQYTVSSSSVVSLSDSASQTIIGLPYTHKLKSVRPEAGSLFGMSQGDVKRIDQVTIRFDRTIACKYGRNEDDTLIDINFRNNTQAMDSVTEMFTGDKKLEFQQGYDRDAYFYLEGSDPLPCSVVGIYIRGVTYD